MNIAIQQLREGLKWADAEIDPKWYGMGDAAHAAMLRFPPFIEWRKENPEAEIDDAALKFARTPEFEKFLMGMFPEEEPSPAEDKQLSVLKDILKELKRMNELKALELGINHPVAEELRQIMA